MPEIVNVSKEGVHSYCRALVSEFWEFPEQLEHLRELFEELDKDNDGNLSAKEIKQGCLMIEGGEALLDVLINADIDGNEKIDFDEFLIACIDQNIFSNEAFLKTAFDEFDTSGDGYINEEEMHKLINAHEIDQDIDPELVTRAMKEFDTNGDGLFSFEEFK